jgi:LacI family transcriptional regulator
MAEQNTRGYSKLEFAKYWFGDGFINMIVNLPHHSCCVGKVLLNIEGYQRIGVITANHNLAGEDRYQGYRHALDEHGLDYDPALTANGDFSQSSGSVAMEQLLLSNPDAVFVVSDTMALGALQAIKRQGLRVPEDIAIVGFDNLPPAVQAAPLLTTIHQPVDESGYKAVEALLQMIENPDKPPQKIVLPTQLIIRDSA